MMLKIYLYEDPLSAATHCILQVKSVHLLKALLLHTI